MFLAEIELENVRSFPSLRLNFTGENDKTRRWTYILGENGIGKSTLLKAIALVTAGSDALSELIGDPDAWIRTGQDQCRIRAVLRTARNESRPVELIIKRGHGIRDLMSTNHEGLSLLDDALSHTLRNYPVIAYGVSRRSADAGKFSIGQDQSPFEHDRARSVATLFTSDARLTPIEQWAMDMEYRRGQEGLEIIQSAFRQLIPHVSFHGIDKENRRLLFKTPDGVVPYQYLSDGYQTIVGWIGDLLYRVTETFSNYKDPFKARGLLMLDELELHLHPLWQRKLTDFLKARLPNFQVIATTHAPLTAHQAGLNELFFIRRGKGKHPELSQYEGEPRQLMLHQLLQTPAFGLDTLDSQYVEGMRDELKRLRAKKTLSPAQQTRLENVRANLAQVPDWQTPSDWEKRQLALMEKIKQRVGDTSTD
ncbi:MAG: AAA family ATPase [Gammaproteobacteria bacterium]